MSETVHRQDYDFGPHDDEYRGFDPHDGEGARGPLILALAIGVLLIFGTIIWNTYKQGVRQEPNALPIVFADDSPYKRVPIDPGGTIVPDQNMRVYDQLDGSQRENRPPFGDAETVLAGGPPIELRPDQIEPLDPETGTSLGVSSQIEAFSDLDTAPDVVSPSADRVVSTPSSVPAEVSVEAQQGPFAFQTDGIFLVQIAALRSQEAADAAWAKAISEDPYIYQGAEKRIQRADLGAKGIFYRLRVGAFETRATASVFCNELKKRGKTCIVATE